MSKNEKILKIERKWQKIWEKEGLFLARDFSKKPKQYILTEFPYPSGEGLHAGHVRTYTAMDIISRKRRMEGFNVLYPIGWDAFGLPTENYAIKTGLHPAKITKKNISRFRKQIKSLGISFDWSREVNTSDPNYYKWTQWIFLKLFEKGLAYKKEMPINWCPSCKIGLANEEVIDGRCERCGAKTKKKNISQWMLKITAYAERLLKDLDKVDYLEKIKTQQKNWIGKSKGIIIKFQIQNSSPAGDVPNGRRFQIEVFTTRPDTLFGATYLVLAPEHPFLQNQNFYPAGGQPVGEKIKNKKEIKDYIKKTATKTKEERIAEGGEKTGIEIQGLKAVNPATNEKIPIWVADYVLMDYGTGAVMAVPAHDQRDFEFAKKYNLPIKMVVCPNFPEQKCPILDKAFEGNGTLINSGKFSGLPSKKGGQKITEWLIEQGIGKKSVKYRLRDWVFSRQHYWGEPIPLVFCENCRKKLTGISNFPPCGLLSEGRQSPTLGVASRRMTDSKQFKNLKLKIKNLQFSAGELLNPGWVAVPYDKLPVKLPYVEKYKPTTTGKSPLANITKWVNTQCPKCKGTAKRETDTMPNWAGSSWYYLAYIRRGNSKLEIRNSKLYKYWLPVDWYNGGMEHTTLHLLYSRFWHKFLYDIGIVPTLEPYKKRTSQGMVLGQDNQKMSKSRGNVVNPDAIVKEYGADALRLYEMFMGPFDQAVSWNQKALVGMSRFLNKAQKLRLKVAKRNISNLKIDELLHKTIKAVSEDIEAMKFNTAIADLMILVNEMSTLSSQPGIASYKLLLKLLAPFAPHLSEELWSELGNKKSIFLEKWPKYNPKLIRRGRIKLVIQVNGRVRDIIETEVGISEQDAKKLALDSEKINKYILGKGIKKIIFIKDKLINIVV